VAALGHLATLVRSRKADPDWADSERAVRSRLTDPLEIAHPCCIAEGHVHASRSLHESGTAGRGNGIFTAGGSKSRNSHWSVTTARAGSLVGDLGDLRRGAGETVVKGVAAEVRVGRSRLPVRRPARCRTTWHRDRGTP
jgi:hypothetical protein